MNAEKLRRLQSQVRIGGKGTPRRKKKVMHQSAATDDKKLQSSLKKLSVSTIPGIEEVNIIKDDLTVIHFNNPKAQASLTANTFAVTGHGETKKIVEMLPEILPQLGQDTVMQLRMFANTMSGGQSKQGNNIAATALENVAEEDEVPMLVNDFEEVAKMEEVKSKTAKQKVDPKSEQGALSKNKENEGSTTQNTTQTVGAPQVEATAKNADKMDKKAKKQQNKQSANGAAKNKSESAKNETKQQKNEKSNKQEVVTAAKTEKKPNETAPPAEKKSQDKPVTEVPIAKDGVAVKEEAVKAVTATALNQQAKPESQKSAQKEDHKTMPQKPKEEKAKKDNVMETKEKLEDKKPGQAPAKESPMPLELKEIHHAKDQQKMPQNVNAPKTPEPILPQQKELKTQEVTSKGPSPQPKEVKEGGAVPPQTKDLNVTQQTQKAASPQPKELKVQQPAGKAASPQPKDLNVAQQTQKAASPQPTNVKAQSAPMAATPPPKDLNSPPITQTNVQNAQQSSKESLPQPKDLKEPPKPKGVSPQPKDVKVQPAPKDASKQSKDSKAQPTTKNDTPQPKNQNTQQTPKGDSSPSVDAKKDEHLAAQQLSEAALPQPRDLKKERSPKIDSPQTNAPNILPTSVLPKSQPSAPTADEKVETPANKKEAQKTSELDKQNIPKDTKPIENKSVEATAAKEEIPKQIVVAPVQAPLKIDDKTAAPTVTNSKENKAILEKPATQNIHTAKVETNIVTPSTTVDEKKDQVKAVAANKSETLPVANKDVVTPPTAQQQISSAVIEKATIQIDEVIAAAAKEVAKLPGPATQPTDVAPVVPKEKPIEVKSSETPTDAVVPMAKKDDSQAKAATKPANQTAQTKPAKTTTPKPNQQAKQTPAKPSDKPSNAAKPANMQQKPSAPPTKKSPTNTPPATPTEVYKPTTPTDLTAAKMKDAKPDAQKKPTNQPPAQKQAQTKPNTAKPTNSGAKPGPNATPATGPGPKKTPPPATQHDNKQTKQATAPKTSENNAAKTKQTSPPKAEGKQSPKPADESKPQQKTPPKANNQPQAAPKANP